MYILKQNPVPQFVATCGHCQSRFTYAKRETVFSTGGLLGRVPPVTIVTCPVCSGCVDCDFVPHDQEQK